MTFWETAFAAGVGFACASMSMYLLAQVLKLIIKGMDADKEKKP